MSEELLNAIGFVKAHPLLGDLAHEVLFIADTEYFYVDKKEGWMAVSKFGEIAYHPKKKADTAEWIYAFSRALLHLGFGHLNAIKKNQIIWETACSLHAHKFLKETKIGLPPPELDLKNPPFALKNEERTYEYLLNQSLEINALSGRQKTFYYDELFPNIYKYNRNYLVDEKIANWGELLGKGIANAVASAIEQTSLKKLSKSTKYEKSKELLISQFPLLGGLAASIKIIDDLDLCRRLNVGIAAINPFLKEIYINPLANLSEQEGIFVIAHELLHAGLQHLERRHGRDDFLWNAACDYVINDWLLEMRVGIPPKGGLLHDFSLKGKSAEDVYTILTSNLRIYRKLSGMRGREGLSDILGEADNKFYTDTSEFYKGALSRGLNYALLSGRGTIPRGLIEEIRALEQPPVPWDVQLANWFYKNFPSQETKRTYSRMNRRQSSTPDIPRAARYYPQESKDSRTFGAIIDTSGSMDRYLLAKAIGTVVAYCQAHDVEKVRLIFCDAYPYDEGYVSVESLLDRVKVKGRGGTVLQPAVNLLEKSEDFPINAPIMVITDGYIENDLRITRNHAFILPKGHQLPFKAQDIFYVSE